MKGDHKGFFVPLDSNYSPETFLTFLMFSPDPNWGIFVPLGMVEWNWSGITVALSENEWTPASLNDTFAGEYESAANYGFPLYNTANPSGVYQPFNPLLRRTSRRRSAAISDPGFRTTLHRRR